VYGKLSAVSEATNSLAGIDQTGRVVLVTGGTKGVGRGITETFLAAGATVVMTARNEPDAPIAVDGNQASFSPADVRDPDQVAALVQACVDAHGRIDVVINNAGGAPSVETATASPRFSQAIVNLNLMAPLYVAQSANAFMQEQDGGGAIINIGSVSGIRPSPWSAAYGAAKAGLVNLTQTLAVEWAPKVRVNMVTGGIIETEQSHLWYGDAEGIAAVAQTIPMARMGTPADIGGACLFLASPLAGFVSGANLVVHGGGEKPAFLAAANAD
jgi:NAD(P)-dependent dehydrogenase (short-subunit alcohol dehydrogenase family)